MQVASISPHPITGATLAHPDTLEQAVAAAPDAMIYPMFMAAGWFTKTELPRRLAAAGGLDTIMLPPFGLDAALPALCQKKVCDALTSQGWAAKHTTLLIIAHGSRRSRGSATGAMNMAQKLRTYFKKVTCGFIEEAPFIAAAAHDLGRHAVALPFFATRAEHVEKDIPEALSESGFSGPCLPPVGLSPEVPTMIARALNRYNTKIAS